MIDIDGLKALRDSDPLDWDEEHSEAVGAAVRGATRDALDALIALGPAADDATVRAILKGWLEGFERLADDFDLVLVTPDRDDIAGAFYQIADLVGIEDAEEFVETYGDW